MHDGLIPVTYGVYLLASVAMTVWVGRTLFRNGRAFLLDAFDGNAALTDAVNRLLVVGFYLVNIGFVSLFLRTDGRIETVRAAIEFLSGKLGVVLLVLGALHFLNLLAFGKARHRALLLRSAPPIRPDERLTGSAA
jgi:hypothetical protein